LAAGIDLHRRRLRTMLTTKQKIGQHLRPPREASPSLTDQAIIDHNILIHTRNFRRLKNYQQKATILRGIGRPIAGIPAPNRLTMNTIPANLLIRRRPLSAGRPRRTPRRPSGVISKRRLSGSAAHT
jgi:hypothetical protein